MKTALKYFENLSDPRSSRNQKHPLMMLIGTTLLASLAGIDSFSGYADFTEAHQAELKNYFDFPHGVPSHDTYQRFWDNVSPTQFLECFHCFSAALAVLTGNYLNIDGKTIRHSGQENPLHIVSAWCQSNQMVLAQEKVSDKSNEITAVPKLLKLLDLKDKIVTLDAMGTQRNTCAQIVEQGGDYVISLKGNQGCLHDDVMAYFANRYLLNACESCEENDKGHGRLEQRTAYVCSDIEWLQKEHEWPGLKSIGVVKARVEKAGKISEEERFYITSLPACARQLGEAARLHWGIENQLHWRLDVVFNEDKACIRNDNAAENVDILRKWALNVLQKAKQKPEQSIKSLMRKNAMSFKHLLQVVNRVFHA